MTGTTSSGSTTTPSAGGIGWRWACGGAGRCRAMSVCDHLASAVRCICAAITTAFSAHANRPTLGRSP
ncbi:hypothetical protein [Nannocystis pusilla]|uniref:hypothetical protein n=1 Tax=Nannocystis pusilla TaxID=889268 RepID=UPI003B7642FE